MCRGEITYVESLEEEKKVRGARPFYICPGALATKRGACVFALFVLAGWSLSLVWPMRKLTLYRPRDPWQKSLLACFSLSLIGCYQSTFFTGAPFHHSHYSHRRAL